MTDFTANFTLSEIEAIDATFVVNQTPTLTSQLTNDSNFVSDANYIHTDNNFTSNLKSSYDDAVAKSHTHLNKTALDDVGGINTGDETNLTILSKIGYTPENGSNKVTSFSSPTDVQYPSAKLVSNQLELKANAVSAPLISSGATAPTSTPAKIGDIYIDTSKYKTYVSVGTSSSSDWIKQNGSYALVTAPLSAVVNPADATTFYFGGEFTSYATGTSTRRVWIPKSGIISKVFGNFHQNIGTSENSALYIRVNNITDYLISNTISHSSSPSLISNNYLNIPVNEGDYIEYKWITPVWATNPTNLYWTFTCLIDL